MYIHKYILHNQGIDQKHIIEIQLDSFADRKYRKAKVLYDFVEKKALSDPEMFYVLLDEVQMLEDFVDVLNGFLHFQNLDIYVTGSNAKFLSSDIITEFRGRGVQIHLVPLLFKEIDFVCNRGSERMYVQSAYSLPDDEKLKKEQRSLTLTGDSFSKWILTTDNIPTHQLENGITLMNVFDYLLRYVIGNLESPNFRK